MNRRELLATSGAVLAGSAVGATSIPEAARTLDDFEDAVHDPKHNPTLSEDGDGDDQEDELADVDEELVGTVAAEHAKQQPEHVTLSFDEALIEEYRPSLVLEGVNPRPIGFYALHAESSQSDLNAVYGFTRYSYQEGNLGRSDSHLGDHEPIIIWYDSTSGDVARVDYAAYHWFKGTALPEQLAFADDLEHRPIFRVDPSYHHYYTYQGSVPGDDVQIENLLDAIPSWLTNGLEDDLARSQPYNPWQMLSRGTWWQHTTSNYVNALLAALWFNFGLSDATATSDLSEVRTW